MWYNYLGVTDVIKYRPQRGGLAEAMREAKEFQTIDEMKLYICDDWGIDASEITIDEPHGNDDRIGWKNVRYVCKNGLAIGYCSIDD